MVDTHPTTVGGEPLPAAGTVAADGVHAPPGLGPLTLNQKLWGRGST